MSGVKTIYGWLLKYCELLIHHSCPFIDYLETIRDVEAHRAHLFQRQSCFWCCARYTMVYTVRYTMVYTVRYTMVYTARYTIVYTVRYTVGGPYKVRPYKVLFQFFSCPPPTSKFSENVGYLTLVILYNITPPILCSNLLSPILPPIELSLPPTKKICISRCVSNAEPQFLQLNLYPIVTAKKKRSAYIFEVKDAVYKAVKRDVMSLALAASVFQISGGKSAV